jgi:subtilisin family serine protease
MNRFTRLLLALALLAFTVSSREVVKSQSDVSVDSRFAAGRMIVKLREEALPSHIDIQASNASQLAERILPELATSADALGVAEGDGGLFVVDLANDISVEDAIRKASSDPRIEYAEPDYFIYPAITPNDAFFGEMWGLMNTGSGFGKPGADIGATGAWDLTTGSSDVVVAVADTGVDLSHPDLAANAWVNPRETAGNGVDDDANGLIDDISGWNFVGNNNQLVESPAVDFHGTHVAGTIGAVGNNGLGTTGVAWNVKIMSLKFLSSTPGTTSNAIKCVRYAIDQKRLGVNVRVINGSWAGSGNSQSLRSVIAEAGNAGIVFVCAAGNGGSDNRGDDVDSEPDYPAAWSAEDSSIISVAALDRNDGYPIFSNYGHLSVTVAAPGVQILSTTPGGGFSSSSGTSMSTPHVSGIVALLAAHSPEMTASQIKNRIIRTSVPVLSAASKTVASGRAHALNALTNQVTPPGTLALNGVRTNKKFVFVDGLNIVQGSAVIEVNGVALRKNKFDEGYALANGTLTQVKAKLGKAGIQTTFPQFTQVFITVFNPTTGERSAPIGFTRF